jgi:hypothetical protein
MQPDIARLISKLREARLGPEAWPDTQKSLTDTLGVASACIIPNKQRGVSIGFAFPV